MTGLLALVVAASANPLAMRQYRTAANAITEVLETRDEPVWYARLGLARARLGHYADALAAFEMGVGSPFYEREGWRAHADVLRATGQCEAAAALRETFVDHPVVRDPVRLWVTIAEDWRACGRHGEAFLALAQAEAREADHPDVHAVLSDLYRDEGHWGSAQYHVDQAARTSAANSYRSVMSSAEHAMRLGDLGTADRMLATVVAGHMRDPRLFLSRSEVWLRQGRLDEAARLAERGPWHEHEDWRVVCRRIAIHRARGDDVRARQIGRNFGNPCPSGGPLANEGKG